MMLNGLEMNLETEALLHIYLKEESQDKRMSLNTTRRLNNFTLPDGLLREVFHGLVTSEELLPDMSIILISTMHSFNLPVS